MWGRVADPSCVRCLVKARLRRGLTEDPPAVWGPLGDHACAACGLRWTVHEYVVRARRAMPGGWCALRVVDARGVEDTVNVKCGQHMELRAQDVIRVHVRAGTPQMVLAVENQNVRRFYAAYLPSRWQ
ncbi:hypothetical protein [Deinococcus soli (ex Cha et al. 2016)]|uniref:Uncharacterized protein n=2 Tax=Deinococcus soli (ex Cha et al. 2016) TaxID=1309411 RepID=A0AAE4BMB5_9DEIO|nr:hypothetical protein [Deinococcus soli (ex Cha et al. 2016)]MDR6218900.1 hypothetical protein [Deinococcus soli (ex Cha et al. 2016)]MDR6328697.1 hypothetical protein [Deinococcus soli (ex Cha et al. 2016)]MDR6751816.1 hypothetical protein [Deinococcus soli (ex Cha et al. 2016)]